MQNVHDAEEVSQEVFTKIYRNASQYKRNAQLSTWIYRITVNTALNEIKKKKRLSILNSGLSKENSINFYHPGVALENKEKAAIMFKAIEKLAETQKTAFILSFIEDLPRKEVADIMGLSLKAVESLLQRAKGNLRKELKQFKPSN